mgnify:CR=1 FL=1
MTARQLILGGAGPASGAVVSPCERYRYRLWRRWGNDPHVLFLLLNPSIADFELDDPTIRRCVGFAKAWERDAIEVVNLYAFRATDPANLRAAARADTDVVGPDNDRHIAEAAGRAPLIVVAWGATVIPGVIDRAARVFDLLPPAAPVFCVGETASGHPRHPLYARATRAPVPFRRPPAP